MAINKRELQITRLKLRGLKQKEIAARLGVTKAYVSEVLSLTVRKITDLQSVLDSLKDSGIITSSSGVRFTESGLALISKRRALRSVSTKPRLGAADRRKESLVSKIRFQCPYRDFAFLRIHPVAYERSRPAFRARWIDVRDFFGFMVKEPRFMLWKQSPSYVGHHPIEEMQRTREGSQICWHVEPTGGIVSVVGH